MTRAGAAASSSVKTVVVLDNGAGLCKAGFAGQSDPAAVVPNCVGRPQSGKRWLVADQVQNCDEIQGIGIRRPMDRGYLINPDLEKEIWDRIFKSLLQIRPSESGLLLVEPPFNLPSIQKSTDELVFEDFGFQSLYVADAASLTHIYQEKREPSSLLARSHCSLVVDCGFSFTHATPVFQKFTCNYAVKRIDLGGKALTNYLKELVSYRAWNVMDETYIMDDVKEKLCYCSLDVAADLETARKVGVANSIQCKYVLPDGVKYKRGFVKDPIAAAAVYRYLSHNTSKEGNGSENVQNVTGLEDMSDINKGSTANHDEQELNLTNERFLVPEMLFRPADLGMNEAGLADCIFRAVNGCHPDLHPILYSSVVLTGGTTQFPGFKERLELELRPLVPIEYELKMHSMDDPILAPWRGGSLLATSSEFEGISVTRAEYEELGSLRCRRRFMH